MKEPVKWISCPTCSCPEAFQTLDGKAMRRMRLRSGVSLRDVATACGVSPMYLSDIERGRRDMRSTNPKTKGILAIYGGLRYVGD